MFSLTARPIDHYKM